MGNHSAPQNWLAAFFIMSDIRGNKFINIKSPGFKIRLMWFQILVLQLMSYVTSGKLLNIPESLCKIIPNDLNAVYLFHTLGPSTPACSRHHGLPPAPGTNQNLWLFFSLPCLHRTGPSHNLKVSSNGLPQTDHS